MKSWYNGIEELSVEDEGHTRKHPKLMSCCLWEVLWVSSSLFIGGIQKHTDGEGD